VTATFIFICPNTRLRIQGFLAEDAPNENTYAPVRCLICTRMHYVNPKTGHVLGEKEGDDED
jgi:hypothetical protein